MTWRRVSSLERADVETTVAGFDVCRRIPDAEPLRSLRAGRAVPDEHVRSDADLEAFVRTEASGTCYHPVGTCRMGVDAMAVVDPLLRVQGIDGLRVADASVMPTLIGGNTNAPTIMLAERAAALVASPAPI